MPIRYQSNPKNNHRLDKKKFVYQCASNYLTRKQESAAGIVIREQGVIDDGLGSNRDAHGNPRSVEVSVSSAPKSRISEAQRGIGALERVGRKLLERNGRESERGGGGGHGGERKRRRCAQDKRVVKEGVHV